MEPFETLTVAMAKSVEERMEVGNLKQLHFMDIIRCFALFLPLLLYDQVPSLTQWVFISIRPHHHHSHLIFDISKKQNYKLATLISTQSVGRNMTISYDYKISRKCSSWKTIISVRLKIENNVRRRSGKRFSQKAITISNWTHQKTTTENLHTCRSKTKRRWIDWNYFAISMEILSLSSTSPVQHTTNNISFRCQISLETNKHFINASTHLMYVKLSEWGESWGRHIYILIVLLLSLVECIFLLIE